MFLRQPDYTPTIAGLSHALAKKYGHAEAVIRDGSKVTYHQLDQQSAAVACALVSMAVVVAPAVRRHPLSAMATRTRASRRRGGACD